MNIQQLGFGRGVMLLGSVLVFSCVHAAGQGVDATTNRAQEGRVLARVTEVVDDSNRVALRGNLHPLARPEFDRGAVEESRPMNRMMLLLQRSADQESALQQLMEEQQQKDSPNFHAWLTPEHFGKRFGPADADIQAITDWLTSQGFQINKVSTGRTVVEFSGIAAQVQNAFRTEIHKFQVKGEEHVANVSEPEIPAALKPVVQAVVGLHNFRPKPMLHRLGTFRRSPNGEVHPLFTYIDKNGTFYAVGPADFRTIYNIPSTATGAGQSIAIVGQSNINLQDVKDFRSMFGLPANDPQIILNGPDPGIVSGDEVESDLDVEWSGAVASQAKIIFVTTQSTNTDGVPGVIGSALYIIDNNIAPVMSVSYGSCEAASSNAFFNGLWQQAAAEGITVAVSAGDNGSAGCDPAAPPANQDVATQGVAISGWASTPYDVALGGTDFDYTQPPTTYWNAGNTSPQQSSAKGYIPETTWNGSCAAGGASACTTTIINQHIADPNQNGVDLVAGSGGPSAVYTTKPTFQTGFGDSKRDIPDISLFSSNGVNGSFYVICNSDQDPAGGVGCNLTTSATSANHDFQGVGGTSAAAPTFAAIVALVNQQTGQRQGNVNYVLYGLAKTSSNVCNSTTAIAGNGCVFYDITKGNISVACQGGTANCSNASTGTGQFGILTTGGSTPAFNTNTGYDLATGLGSLNVTNLLAKWAAPARTATSTTLNLSSNSIAADTPVTVSGTVSPSTATGIVLLENASTGAAIPITSTSTNAVSGGNYSFTTASLPGGTYNVIAHYSGDGTFAASNSTPAKSVTVTPQSSRTVVTFVTFDANNNPILNTGAVSVSYGSAYILRVDVQNNSGQTCQNLSTGTIQFVCPTGTVTLTKNAGVPLNDFPNAQNPNATNVANLNDRGFAEDQPIQLAPGSYSIAASYSGDNSYSASASAGESVTITKAATAVQVTPNPASITSGGAVTLTANIVTTSNGAGPTGTVQFKNGSTNLGSPVTCTPTAASSSAPASCTATLSTTLSQLMPMPPRGPDPKLPVRMIWIVACLLLILFMLGLRRLPMPKRQRYAYAILAFFAIAVAGIAGCSGSNGSTGGGSHTDTITATYSGDANYSSSSGTGSVTVR